MYKNLFGKLCSRWTEFFCGRLNYIIDIIAIETLFLLPSKYRKPNEYDFTDMLAYLMKKPHVAAEAGSGRDEAISANTSVGKVIQAF